VPLDRRPHRKYRKRRSLTGILKRQTGQQKRADPVGPALLFVADWRLTDRPRRSDASGRSRADGSRRTTR
jgi:hypothetical protein